MRRLLLLAFGAALASCGGGGGGGLPTTTPAQTSTPSAPSTPAAPLDDWTTYAHDTQRTGFEKQTTGINSSTVQTLSLAWRATPNTSCATTAESNDVVVDEASPLVANGYVYYADACGNVAALNTANGNVVWQTQVPGVATLAGAQGTPTLDPSHNLLIVPMHGSDPGTCNASALPCATPASGGFLVALNATSGQIAWQQAPLVRGNLRGEPIAIDGIVYEGLAGGDAFSGATDGGIFALDESTGNLLTGTNLPMVQAAPPTELNDGGGSWTPISYDGNNTLYFGFGNTVNNDGLQDSVASLDLRSYALTQNFSLATFDGLSADEDVGGGELLWNGDLYFQAKNGRFYGYNPSSPSVPIIDTIVNAPQPGVTTAVHPGNGAIWTPTTDGNVIAVAAGYLTVPPTQPSSQLDLFPVGGDTAKCWSLTSTNSALYSYAAFVNGVGFTVLDNEVPNGTPDGGTTGPAPAFVAFDDNCNVLWKATQTDLLAFFYGGPAVVPSGVYAIDDMGNVYAWKLPSAATSLKNRTLSKRPALIRPGVRSSIRTTQYQRKSAAP
jgi:hypothetical protein